MCSDGDDDPHPTVERAKSWIGEHLGEDLDMTELATELGVSRYYLHHLFKMNDPQAMHLATVHNLRFYGRLMELLAN